jgi:hypothetical protein
MLKMPEYGKMEQDAVYHRRNIRNDQERIKGLTASMEKSGKGSADYRSTEEMRSASANSKFSSETKLNDVNNAMAKARRAAMTAQAARLSAARATAPTTARPASGASKTAYRPQPTATGGIRQNTSSSSVANRRR